MIALRTLHRAQTRIGNSLPRAKETIMMYTRRWHTLAVGLLLMGLCLGVTGALAQTTTMEVTSVTLEKSGVVTVSVA
jgi:hypothetical protein